MRSKFIFIFILFSVFAGAIRAQLTLNVTGVPASTPPGATIYVAGSFNNWNPGDPNSKLTALGNGQYTITVNPPAGPVQFKFTRGSWPTVEGDINGNVIPNRTLTYSGQAQTVSLVILSWEDLDGGGNSTAASNVQILDDDFYIPQLNRTRRIWLYLPPDYNSTAKHYPVLYMHDGQNLFDAATAFAGEWEVDESLNELHQQGDYGCIVVGIDNGGTYRLDEYSPWFNSTYNDGGDGDLYLEFIVNTLKPHIDSLYRTLPGRNATGIMGSSLGGLISMYGLIERQDVFSKAGIFSPAFWFGGNGPVSHVLSTGKQADVRVYFLAGGEEPASVESNMNAVAGAMLQAGFSAAEQTSLVPSDGQHSEWFWAREFPAAYEWLFAGALSSTADGGPASVELEVFPNPAGDWVRLGGPDKGDRLMLRIVGADGRLWRDSTLRGGEAVWTGDLPRGFYVIKVKKAGKNWQTGKMVRE